MDKDCENNKCEVKIGDDPIEKLDREIEDMMSTDIEKELEDDIAREFNTKRLSVKYSKPDIGESKIEEPEKIEEEFTEEDIAGFSCSDAVQALEQTGDVMIEIQCASNEEPDKCMEESKQILEDFKNGKITAEELEEKMKKLVSQQVEDTS